MELDAVMEAIGDQEGIDLVLPEGDSVLPADLAKKTPILTNKKGGPHRVMWLCEVDGELMVLQKLRDFRESEQKGKTGTNEEDSEEDERVS